MALPVPNLDDRTFAQLVEAARQRILLTCPEWTDLSVGDPGMVLLEAFAYLTETMIYRLNRLPEKSYIAFLRLLGVTLLPPAPAAVELLFSRPQPEDKPVLIPRGTRVTVARPDSGSQPPIFALPVSVSIPAGQKEVLAPACHCELVDGELVGQGKGTGGLVVNVTRPPIVAPTGDSLELVVGVEATREELDERAPAREFDGQVYRIWREVENFTQIGPDSYVYIVDRVTGTITFAPSVRTKDKDGALPEAARALAAIPKAGRKIRVWYRCGGGPQGNLSANTLTVLKDSIPGISVNNPSAAIGGRSAESVTNALLRGPQELHSLQRAVTARDFELVASRFGAVSRAHATTKAALWSFASPGTVDVVLVPFLEEQKRTGQVSLALLQSLQTEQERARIQAALDERRPLGTTCAVSWARYKPVKVHARLVAHKEEDLGALKKRVLDHLYEIINPLPMDRHSGWKFGQSLRISNVYDAALSEPGVNYLEDVQMVVEEVPESQISCLAVDAFQATTWYAGAQGAVYRSMDDGEGWVATGRFDGQTVHSIQAHPDVPGLIAISTRDAGGASGSRVHVSWDCGEHWQQKALTAFDIEQMAWAVRDDAPLLFLATSVGLFELSMQSDAAPAQIFIRPDDQQIGYYAVAVANVNEGVSVAVASQRKGGIFLSSQGGKGNTFRNIGMAGEDARVLAVQYDGTHAFLWAGMAAKMAGDPGKGCFAWELLEGQDPAEGWVQHSENWLGGSCLELAFQGSKILAGTYDAGVLWLERRADQEPWHAPDINCGLPQASREHPLEPVDTMAADPQRSIILAGGKSGVFRSRDMMMHYESCSRKVFVDKVTLPPNWLFCSGEHEIEVTTGNEKRTD